MTTTNLREQLHQQIDRLPDELIEQIADLTSFVMAKRKISQGYTDWDKPHWPVVLFVWSCLNP